MKRSSHRRSELFWPRIVLRKWLHRSAKDPDFSADSSDDDCDADVDDDSVLDLPVSEEVPQLRRRNSETFRAQYINRKELRICVGTWNVGGKVPPDELDIDKWLDVCEPADVYVLGLQEIVPLNAGNIFGTGDRRPILKWENIIRDALHRICPERKYKSLSDPPSPSKFEAPGDSLDVEDELLLDSGSECEEQVHPLENVSVGLYEVKDKSAASDGLTAEYIVSNGNASFAAFLSERDMKKEFYSPRKLDGLRRFETSLCEEDGEKSELHTAAKLSRAFSVNGRTGLSCPEPPMNLLAQHVFQRACSFGPRSTNSFKSSKSFRRNGSFKPTSNEDSRPLSDIAMISEIDLEKLVKQRRRPEYTRIVSKQMVGIFLTVWVRKGLRKHVKNLKVSTVGVGAMGYIGNKGSVSVSMDIHQTPFCFICTHLTSGEKEGDELKRTADVHEIHRRTHFNPNNSLHFSKSIRDHERIIWLGDLNYRINLPYGETRKLIAEKQWSKLIERDQLRQELKEGRAFEGWFEGRLNFPPTYKYEPNSEKYCGEDPKSGRRNPAWCDRVLSFGRGIELLSYKRAELKLSDHRPVTATFMVEVEDLCPKKLQQALAFTDAEIKSHEVRIADGIANAALSQLRLDQHTSDSDPDA